MVPSPTSASCARAMSTSVRAAGCTTSSSFKIVAPSSAPLQLYSFFAKMSDPLEMVAWPRSSTMSLSMPRGPRVVAMVWATARHAEMFDSNCGVPCDVSVPSTQVGQLCQKEQQHSCNACCLPPPMG